MKYGDDFGGIGFPEPPNPEIERLKEERDLLVAHIRTIELKNERRILEVAYCAGLTNDELKAGRK